MCEKRCPKAVKFDVGSIKFGATGLLLHFACTPVGPGACWWSRAPILVAGYDLWIRGGERASYMAYLGPEGCSCTSEGSGLLKSLLPAGGPWKPCGKGLVHGLARVL